MEYNHKYPPGKYEVQVVVKKKIYLFEYAITSSRANFVLSGWYTSIQKWKFQKILVLGTLNGELLIIQKNETLKKQFVSTDTAVISSVFLSKPDAKYLENATSVTSYWFIDCVYYGPTNNGLFIHKFPKSEEEHTIDVLMVADFHPTPPPTTTTTEKPTTTTTTEKPSTSTALTKAPANVSTTAVPSTQKPVNGSFRAKRSVESVDANRTQNIMMNVNGTLQRYNGSFPYICNGTVAVDETNSYGYFSRHIVAKGMLKFLIFIGNYSD